MIVVIADDITGAAELGGIALRFGLKVIVSDDVQVHTQPDVLIIYTNTRSMQKKEAVKIMESVTAKVKLLHPSLFYKKTDSVLRGHVLAEMKAQMKTLNFNKALLVPVNPSLGRVIKNGHYYVNGQAIHETGFSSDPEYPITNSSVEKILGKENIPVKLISKNDSLIENGISVGEAATNEDIADWANYSDGSILLAGGASFFNMLLEANYPVKKQGGAEVRLSLPLVMISGTTYQKNVDRIKNLPHLVSYMPPTIFSNTTVNESDYEEWDRDIMRILSKYNKVIVAIDNHQTRKADPNLLREKQAAITRLILEKQKIKELLIEGGSTAYSIVKKLNWPSFVPTEELQQGIVRMQVEGKNDLHLTIKPGSYEWPSQWNFN